MDKYKGPKRPHQHGLLEKELRTNDLDAAVGAGIEGQKQPGGGLKTTRRRQRNEKVFTKIFTLGAHRMTGSSLFNRATRVFLLLVRDAGYGGRCYTNATLIANELGLDPANVRKIICALESEQMLMKIDGPTPYYLLNPYYVMSGDDQSEEIARAIWSRERTKRIEAARKTKKPATARA